MTKEQFAQAVKQALNTAATTNTEEDVEEENVTMDETPPPAGMYI